MWAYVEIARIDHWFKNVFVIPGVIFALLADRAILGSQLIVSLAITAVAVCLAAIRSACEGRPATVEYDFL